MPVWVFDMLAGYRPEHAATKHKHKADQDEFSGKIDIGLRTRLQAYLTSMFFAVFLQVAVSSFALPFEQLLLCFSHTQN